MTRDRISKAAPSKHEVVALDESPRFLPLPFHFSLDSGSSPTHPDSHYQDHVNK